MKDIHKTVTAPNNDISHINQTVLFCLVALDVNQQLVARLCNITIPLNGAAYFNIKILVMAPF